jgi:glutamine cyclotransferase
LTIASTVLIVAAFMFVSPRAKTGNPEPTEYSYKIINVYPHDESAFTEGLLIDDGFLYESTGIYGNSSLRRIDLETGEILRLYSLPTQYFGEGVTIVGNKIVQLTWLSETGFVYNKETFDLLQDFTYSTEGWGITYDGSKLIMSDGTSTLHFLDPDTFQETGEINVSFDNSAVEDLNELEYVQGRIYANIWHEEKIAIINPQTGEVEAWINMNGIQNMENRDSEDVLNGIAYDPQSERLFVTGKRWPQLYEIELIPLGYG